MNDQIRQIAERLRGLRDVLDISEEQMAQTCHLPLDDYRRIESGTVDISVSVLQTIARRYGVSLGELMFDETPKMSSYFITRRGAGMTVERREAYRYQSLASGFKGRLADPFIVTVEPKPDTEEVPCNAHEGQEFNLVVEGRMQLSVGGKTLTLAEGDSIYFNSALPHNMRALDGKRVRFLAVIM